MDRMVNAGATLINASYICKYICIKEKGEGEPLLPPCGKWLSVATTGDRDNLSEVPPPAAWVRAMRPRLRDRRPVGLIVIELTSTLNIPYTYDVSP